MRLNHSCQQARSTGFPLREQGFRVVCLRCSNCGLRNIENFQKQPKILIGKIMKAVLEKVLWAHVSKHSEHKESEAYPEVVK